MIQRKQTIFLLLVAGIITAMLFQPLITVTHENKTPTEIVNVDKDGNIEKVTIPAAADMRFDVWGVHSSNSSSIKLLHLTIFVFIIIALALVTVFLYKNRSLQLKFCIIINVLLVVMIGYIALYIYKLQQLPEVNGFSNMTPSIAILFPILALLFSILAHNGITKDIKLLRSLDRIR